jgi:glycerol kinase
VSGVARKPYLLALDQGTTSSRALLLDARLEVLASNQQRVPSAYPHNGWVEQDPAVLLESTLLAARGALERAGIGAGEVAAAAIANQRETTLLWDRRSGQAAGPAIVWQDRRTHAQCEQLRASGAEPWIRERTGLLVDPYFSATKLQWLLEHVPRARERAQRGELAFGTVDSYLIWCLTGGRVHATDATNASRTLLFDIHAQQWSPELLELFGVPAAILPEVRDSAADYGETVTEAFGRRLPIHGVAGDQHAAMVGQGCLEPGSIKSTYGTGCFALLNTGDRPVRSQHRLLTTMAYRIDGKPAYALEGSIFTAGAAVQWLRDELGVIDRAEQTETLARGLESNHGVYLVPAFTGLGAPYWDPHARGALFGLTRDTGVAALARAALESVCYQSHDLVVAMTADAGNAPVEIRVDGGMTVNDWFLQCLADLLDLRVLRPVVTETTALGAAYLAGLGHGIWSSLAAVRSHWQLERRFDPLLDPFERQRALDGWSDAVRRVTARD